MTIPGLVLTGGRSLRMGAAKATLRVGDESLAGRTARLLAAVCAPAIEVGPGHSGLAAVVEDPPGAGPVAALVAGCAALRTDGPVVLVACDLPFVTTEMLRLLADWPGSGTVVPLLDGRPQPGCARFGADAIVVARRDPGPAGRSFRSVLGAIDAEHVSEARWRPGGGPHALVDVDTPADAARWGVQRPR